MRTEEPNHGWGWVDEASHWGEGGQQIMESEGKIDIILMMHLMIS